MPTIDFDRPINRRSIADCKKWQLYPADVLPMWVADTDFAVAAPIVEALQERLAHPVFGYAQPPEALREAIVDRLQMRHGWEIRPDDLVFLPGVEPGFNMALKAMLKPGDGVVVQTPMYRPILSAPGHWGLKRVEAPLIARASGFALDKESFGEAVARSRALLFCNPHNPTGKVFTDSELLLIAQACENQDLLIISDEIHCDLVYPGHRHRPIATLGPEIAARTITLMSASKTFNIAGLKTAFAIIQNPVLRRQFQDSRLGMVDSVNLMGLEATCAAYRHCEGWRQEMLAYLQANRDHLAIELTRRFPAIRHHPAEASFLAWLDCSALDLAPDPFAYFLEHARVGLSAGSDFGATRAGHVRLNFGCTRAVLDEALDRMERAIA